MPIKRSSFLIKLPLQLITTICLRWSTRTYLEINKLTDPSQCSALCLLAGTITCHFSLFLNGTCYLGNILYSPSVLTDRTDAQNISLLQGNFYFIFISFFLSLLFILNVIWIVTYLPWLTFYQFRAQGKIFETKICLIMFFCYKMRSEMSYLLI